MSFTDEKETEGKQSPLVKLRAKSQEKFYLLLKHGGRSHTWLRVEFFIFILLFPYSSILSKSHETCLKFSGSTVHAVLKFEYQEQQTWRLQG